MDSQDKPQHEESIPAKTAPLAGIPDPVTPLPAQPDTATELKKLEQQATNLEKQTTAFEKSSLRWVKLSVLMSFLTFIFISLQWHEMHTGSADTAKLAQAATDQAVRTTGLVNVAKFQLDEMKKTNINTHDLADAAGKQAKGIGSLSGHTARSANAAVIASNVAKDTLDLTRQMDQPFVIVESLTTSDFPDGKKPSFILGFKNFGHENAFNVYGNTTAWVGVSINTKIVDQIGNFRIPVIPPGNARAQWLTITAEWERYKDAIKAGTTHFYIWGIVNYEDQRGKKFPSKSYCFIYDPRPERPPSQGLFENCTTD